MQTWQLSCHDCGYITTLKRKLYNHLRVEHHPVQLSSVDRKHAKRGCESTAHREQHLAKNRIFKVMMFDCELTVQREQHLAKQHIRNNVTVKRARPSSQRYSSPSKRARGNRNVEVTLELLLEDVVKQCRTNVYVSCVTRNDPGNIDEILSIRLCNDAEYDTYIREGQTLLARTSHFFNDPTCAKVMHRFAELVAKTLISNYKLKLSGGRWYTHYVCNVSFLYGTHSHAQSWGTTWCHSTV